MNKLSLVAAALSACLMSNTLNAAQNTDDKPQWTLNMQNAELRDLVGEVGKITGKTIVIDPNLNGRVTVQAQAAMSKEDIYSLFLSVLRRQGFTAIDQGDRTVIVPVDKAKTMASSATGDEAEAFVTRIIDLHNTSAN
ncbi:MAG: type II secretion system protein GspD, partial [Pseudomonas sp.]